MSDLDLTVALAKPWRGKKVIVQYCLALLDRVCGGKVSFVQVGANDGVLADPILPYVRDSAWTGVMIEPHPTYFKDLQALHGGRDRIRLENCAVSDQPGTLELHFLAEAERENYPDWARGCASMTEARMYDAIAGHRLDGTDCVISRDIDHVSVPARRLDDILDGRAEDTPDFILADVEGFEVSVLKSVDLTQLPLRAAMIECNKSDRKDENEIARLLAQAGLVTFRLRGDLLALHPTRFPMTVEDLLRFLDQPFVPPAEQP